MGKSDFEAPEEVVLVGALAKGSINGGALGRNIHSGMSMWHGERTEFLTVTPSGTVCTSCVQV